MWAKVNCGNNIPGDIILPFNMNENKQLSKMKGYKLQSVLPTSITQFMNLNSK